MKIRSALTGAARAQVRSGSWTSSQAAQPDPSAISEVSQLFRVE